MSPIDILYIVLAFCLLWITAGLCWLVWQVANVLRRVSQTIEDAQEKMGKIESALSGIRTRFEAMVSPASLLAEGLHRLLEHVAEKRRGKKAEDAY